MPSAGNQLKLSFGINAPESRAIFTDTKLPDNSPVGVRLSGYTDYANLVYTGTTTSGTQSWTSTTDVTLTDTKGTLYAYWPQNNAVSIDAIDVDMTAADQTDWLYATPVTDVNEDKASVAVTMNHALANINVTVNKGSYLGAGYITNITVQSDGIALGGTFNAAQTTPGYTAFEDEGKPLSRTVTTTTGAAATDIMVVPTGTSAAITFLLTIDDIQFTAKSAAVQLAMGNSYQYTLNLSDISTYMEVSEFSVTPWGAVAKDNLYLDVYDPYKDWISATFYVDESEIVSRSGGAEIKILSSYTYFKLETIDRMVIDNVEITPTKTYIFETAGEHTVKYLLKNMKALPDNIFGGYNSSCLNLKKIYIPEGITTIGEEAFNGCTGLNGNLVIPKSVKIIGESAFSGCSGLTGELIIPEGVTSIGQYAFSGCNGFTGALTIPNSMTKIEGYVFSGCSGLTGELIIPEGVTSIGQYAFSNCSGLSGQLVIPNSVTNLERLAFQGCKGFTGKLVIPDAVTSIGVQAFQNCYGLTELELGKELQTIENGAFWNCSKLTGNLIIPETVTSIGHTAFSGCSGLTGELVIPEGVTRIEYNKFNGCKGFTGKLVIPDAVTFIGESAFSECSGFNGNLVIPENVTIIKNNTFQGCKGLTSVTIPNSVTSIEYSAFSMCAGLKEIEIGSSVTSIGNTAFYYCKNLEKIISLATTAPTIKNSTFQDVKTNGVLIIPKGCTNSYSWWRSTSSSYLGFYNWTIQEQNE